VIFDFCIIGGGIVGIATARDLLRRFPSASLVLVEKEAALALHQTGRNSGVIHAGVYYAPGSLKARYCREGARDTKAFCDSHDIKYDVCGKLLVATDESELGRMNELETRARSNDLDVERIDAAALREREPSIRGVGALLVKTTAIVDYRAIARAMAADLVEQGADLRFQWPVAALAERPDRVTVSGAGGSIEARIVVACAGVHADVLARSCGLDLDFQIVPFRGDYFRLPAARNDIVRHLIYPIPDPALPFLGIHLTRMIDGSVTVGPNAALALAREGYGRLSFDVSDVIAMLRFSGFRKVMWNYRKSAVSEALSALSKRRYLEACRRYCPELTLDDLLPHRSGIRAQAVRADGTLVHDFLIESTPRSIHVCNAPSPAATSAIPIARHLADLVADRHSPQVAVPEVVAA
jgi:(S)-2-hydroxyglutarate dehydrogenase